MNYGVDDSEWKFVSTFKNPILVHYQGSILVYYKLCIHKVKRNL